MRLKKTICMVLACMLIVGTISVPVSAAETESTGLEKGTIQLAISRASGSFSMTIPAKSKSLATVSCPIPGSDYLTGTLGPFTNRSNFTINALG